MAKLPSFQFYPGDWLKDANLRRCTHAAKGVWIDILCLMFEADERGVLSTNGVAWSDEDIACAIGGDTATTISAIQELTFKGVAKRRANGALYSKRMVADENKRKLCSAAGKKGGGNPNLTQKGETFKGHSKGGVKGSPKGGVKGIFQSSLNVSFQEREKEKEKENFPPHPLYKEKERERDFCENNQNSKLWTWEQVRNIASLPDVALSEVDARKFFDFYAAQGWVRSNGQRLTSLAPAMRTWKRNKGKFDATSGGSPLGGMEITLDELKAAYKHKINFYDAMHISTETQIKALKSQDLESFKRYVGFEYDAVMEIARKQKGKKC